MKNNLLQEVLISIIIIVLLLLFINPFGFWMPNALLMTMVLGLIVAFTIFSIFIWKEKAKDERETLHKMLAGRISYMVGAGILVLGVIFQSLKHQLDLWLVLTLGAMILAKISGLIYGRMKN